MSQDKVLSLEPAPRHKAQSRRCEEQSQDRDHRSRSLHNQAPERETPTNLFFRRDSPPLAHEDPRNKVVPSMLAPNPSQHLESETVASGNP
jgi:hypothetical protein